jgi:hypothetical protein
MAIQARSSSEGGSDRLVTRPRVRRADVPLLRLAAQRLAGGQFESPLDAASWLTAAQGQDFRGVQVSIALRTTARSVAAVRDAFDAGEIVRSWPMRGTLHAVAADDLGWMLDVAAGRVLTGTESRRRQLGLDELTLTRARGAALEALRGGRRLTREELFRCWQSEGIDTSGQRGIHVILFLALHGVVCYGPIDGAQQQLVLLDDWVKRPRRLSKDDALREWALRFFRSHGPATTADLARWTKLPLGECRAGLGLARDELLGVDVDGVEHWMDPQTPDLLSQWRGRASGVFLLPGFDEYVLGYADRSVIIADAHGDRVVPGNNGMFQHTIVSRGQVIGTWRRQRQKGADVVVPEPFLPPTPRLAELIERAARALP